MMVVVVGCTAEAPVQQISAEQHAANVAAAERAGYKTVANACSQIKARLGVTRTNELVRLAMTLGNWFWKQLGRKKKPARATKALGMRVRRVPAFDVLEDRMAPSITPFLPPNLLVHDTRGISLVSPRSLAPVFPAGQLLVPRLRLVCETSSLIHCGQRTLSLHERSHD